MTGQALHEWLVTVLDPSSGESQTIAVRAVGFSQAVTFAYDRLRAAGCDTSQRIAVSIHRGAPVDLNAPAADELDEYIAEVESPRGVRQFSVAARSYRAAYATAKARKAPEEILRGVVLVER